MASVLVLLLATPVVGQSLAEALTQVTTLEVVPLVRDYESVVLTISGPDTYIRREFSSAEAVAIDLAAEMGAELRDGSFSWEMVFVPRHRIRKGAGAEVSYERHEARVESGSFTVENGMMVKADVPEGGFAKDIVHNDDVIITFSLCVGSDCVNNENFGFDTIRLKENNLRIHFDDTSNSGSFPANDWRIVANDTGNGGASYLAIEDSTAGRIPFRVEAGARANALVVDSNSNIGIGTLNPAVELQVVDGNTPTLRLQQDGSSGFTPQTWDVAGNEANFFVRDLTNNSRLVFRIKPGAPENSLFIDQAGSIGLGTQSPQDSLHIQSTATSNATVRYVNSDATADFWRLGLNNNEDFVINYLGDSTAELRVSKAGEIFVSGVGPLIAPDYVFAPDYDLMALDELESFVNENRHLPKVPSAAEMESEGINITKLQFNLLEKIEELTLYTLQQQKAIEELLAEKEALAARLEALEER
jgi:hypothetical protein